MHEGSLTIRIQAEIPEIERLHRLARQFGELLEIPGRALYSLTLALDELVSNAVLYAFDDPVGQVITVKIEATPGLLRAVIEDTGRAFDPLSTPAPNLAAPLEERQLGGLGVHLVRNLMDEVEYRREGSKNLLTIRKRIR